MKDDKPTARTDAQRESDAHQTAGRDEHVAYWRGQWKPSGEYNFEQDYSPAYRYGVDAFTGNPEKTFKDMEPQLGEGWSSVRETSRLSWSDARLAAMDAWQRAWDLTHRDND